MPNRGIVVIAHAPIASALAAAVTHVLGDLPASLLALDIPATREPAAHVTRCLATLLERGWHQPLILTDLPGATPYRVATGVAAALSDPRCPVVCGVHLGMLLALLEADERCEPRTLARLASVEGRRRVVRL